jgi:hypothetical protein
MAKVVDDEDSRYGRTESGKLLNDEVIEGLAVEAEAGYDVEPILRRRPGQRPTVPPPRS